MKLLLKASPLSTDKLLRSSKAGRCKGLGVQILNVNYRSVGELREVGKELIGSEVGETQMSSVQDMSGVKHVG
jgi:hypothetical protein